MILALSRSPLSSVLKIPRRNFVPGRTRMKILSFSGGSSSFEKCPKLEAARRELAAIGANALIVPSDDPHLSEYTADCFARRAFISGFTGSAGTAVITEKHALLWTDNRYFIQAEQELGPDWTLMRQGESGVPEIGPYLAGLLRPGSSVVIDPLTFAAAPATALRATFDAAGITMVTETKENIVDTVWASDRPPAPTAPLRVHPAAYAGTSAKEKLKMMRESLSEAGADVMIVAALDEVAWLLNLRGADVKCNPVFLSYALVEQDGPTTLFVDISKLSDETSAHLSTSGVAVAPYKDVAKALGALIDSGKKVCADPARTNFGLWSSVPLQQQKPVAPSPIAAAKSVKNGAEMAGMKAAHLRDGVAMVEFLSWLHKTVSTEGRTVTEVEIDEKVTGWRKAQGKFLDVSFPTIAGSGGNGAIAHYRALPETCGNVGPDSMLLLDSGGQYEDGTTDLTRTIHLGTPSAFQMECFTRVLKGHIGVDSVVFPEKTPGFVLDVLARRSLWEAGLNYGHGTGHGVGAALNVHEGPQGISPRYSNLNVIRAGMVLSNEPAYYERDEFGIRIENLLQVVFADAGPTLSTPPSSNAESSVLPTFLKFERLTMVPIQKSLIDVRLLTPDEVSWVNKYHADVRAALTPLGLSEEASAWLRIATEPL